MTNYYSNPTSLDAYMAAVVAQRDRWLSITTMCDIIAALNTVNFSSRASRVQGLAMLDNAVRASPYRITGSATAVDGDIKFGGLLNTSIQSPVAAIFVNTSKNGWAEAWDTAHSALEYADRNNEKTMLTNDDSGPADNDSSSTPNPQVTRSQYNDASQAFKHAKLKFNTMLKSNVSVYNGPTFEGEYGLNFSTTPQSPVDPPPE